VSLAQAITTLGRGELVLSDDAIDPASYVGETLKVCAAAQLEWAGGDAAHERRD
jgi:hypothetical protein